MLPGRTVRTQRKRLSVRDCRRLLGAAGAGLTDEAIAKLRDEFYTLAGCVIEAFKANAVGSKKALALLTQEDRVEVEERAAIHQFDGQLPEGTATRLAVDAFCDRTRKRDKRSIQ